MKRFMAILLAGMLSLSAAVPSFAAVATNAGKWAKPSIEFAYQQGLLTEADLQKAKSPMTRKDFCKMVMRFLNVITGKEWKAAGKTPFTDCDDADVTAAYELGIIGGTDPGIFEPRVPDAVCAERSADPRADGNYGGARDENLRRGFNGEGKEKSLQRYRGAVCFLQ